MSSESSRAARTVPHLSQGERSDRIVRCDPGEGSRTIDRPYPLTPTLSPWERGRTCACAVSNAPMQAGWLALLVALVLAVTMLPAHAQERLNVVASFSILADLVLA